MALTNITIDFDLSQLLGSDFDHRRTKAYVATNVANGTLMDTSTGETRLGDEAVQVGTDGTGSFTIWATGSDGNPTSWQTSLVVDYPRTGQRDRTRRTFGPWTLTTADDGKNIVELEEEQAVPAEYLTTVTTSLSGLVTTAEGHAEDAADSATAASGSATDAEAAKVLAEAAAADATAIVIADADEVVATLVPDTDTATGAAVAEVAALPAHKLATDGSEPRGVVCWTYDDGYSTIVDYFGLLDARDIKGTLFLTKNWVNQVGTNGSWNDTYPTQAQVQAVAAAGHEIGTHGLNHESVVNVRTNDGDAALATMYDSLVDYIEGTYTDGNGDPVVVRTGAYPAGASDRRSREIMGRRHLFFRGTKSAVAEGAWNPFDVPAIDVQNLTEAAIKAYIDTAVAEDSLCVFLIHGGKGTEPDVATLMTKLGNCMDYADAQGARQMRFDEAMLERTQRRSPGALDDTSGNAFRRRLRTQRLTLARSDLLADSTYMEIDPVSNVAYATGSQPFEFRGGGARVTGDKFQTGRQREYAATATSGNATLTVTGLQLDDSVIGKTLAGTHVPANAVVGSYTSTTVTMKDATSGLAANAVGTGAFTLTIGFDAAPVSKFFQRTEHHGGIRAVGASAGTSYDIYTLDGTRTVRYSAGGITRDSSGTYTIDTAGGNLELEAAKVKFQEDGGAVYLVLDSTVPADGTIANGETYIYPDAASGALLYKGKDSGGTVFGPHTLARTGRRVYSVADTATLTIAAGSYDAAKVTALAQAMTIAAPTGTPNPMQSLIIRIKDNGTARALTWNAAFRAVGTLLPTTTTISKTVYVGAIYNSDDSKWDVVAVATEA